MRASSLVAVLSLAFSATAFGQALQLPFAPGTIHQCVQGTDQGPSHNIASTRLDLDFDTGGAGRRSEQWKPPDEVVTAPVTGTARTVPDPHPGEYAGFGNQVQIEVPSSTVRRRYVLVGHLKSFLIKDGTLVSQGQPIGIEGCTGRCDGDHVHVGLHEGI